MATKRIKFIKAWQMVPVGAERDFDTPVADLLIANGRAKEVAEDIIIKTVLDLSGSEDRLRRDTEKALAPVKEAKRLRKLRGNKGK